MAMPAEKQYISAEEFLELVNQPQYQDRRLDLVEGEIIEMPKPTVGHGEIVIWLSTKIASYVYENDLGRVTGGDAGFVVRRNPAGRATVRGLDIAFISKAKAPNPLPRGWVEIPPDLAVEVISPGNQAGDIHKKVRELLKAGTPLIWLVYAETRTVVVHTAASAVTYEESDTLSGGDALPGFEVRVGDIFPVG